MLAASLARCQIPLHKEDLNQIRVGYQVIGRFLTAVVDRQGILDRCGTKNLRWPPNGSSINLGADGKHRSEPTSMEMGLGLIKGTRFDGWDLLVDGRLGRPSQ